VSQAGEIWGWLSQVRVFAADQIVDDAAKCGIEGLPFGLCPTSWLNNWVSASIAATFMALAGWGLTRTVRSKRQGHDEGQVGFDDGVQGRLLAEARKQAWGQLNELIVVAGGFVDLRLEPKVGLVSGRRAMTNKQRNQLACW